MNNVKRYQELASKWLNGTITEEEKIEFSQWYNHHNDEEIFIPSSFAQDEEELRDRILLKVKQGLHPVVKDITRHRRLSVWTVAASLALFCLFGITYYTIVKQDTPVELTVGLEDIQPGGNKAILTLPNGQIVDLDGQKGGLTVGDNIQYIDGAEILNEHDLASDALANSYVTLSTPKGGQYHINLPDGSQVWLNSSSSLKFPRTFKTQYREVELVSGEAYFKINTATKDNARIPFYVRNGLQKVEVLGTEFNINVYEADYNEVVTTVTEGVVTVEPATLTKQKTSNKVKLTVGKQSVLKGQHIQVKDVDPEMFVAWKEGCFYFNEADIYTVMKEFARWYDIEVQYEISKTDDRFVGKIPKNVSLGTALRVLKRTGVTFEMSGTKHLIIRDKQ